MDAIVPLVHYMAVREFDWLVSRGSREVTDVGTGNAVVG